MSGHLHAVALRRFAGIAVPNSKSRESIETHTRDTFRSFDRGPASYSADAEQICHDMDQSASRDPGVL